MMRLMKTISLRFILLLTMLALVAACVWSFLRVEGPTSSAAVAPHVAVAQPQRATLAQRVREVAESAKTPLPAPVVSSPAAPVDGGVDAFAPMLAGAEFERMERRMFQAQTWETDLAKGLDLKQGQRLERRSGLYRLPGARYERVRVDRVYRLGGVPQAAAAVAHAASPSSVAAKTGVLLSTKADAVAEALAPLDAGGGEMVWSNAMVADHVMVQVEPGITRGQLASRLPALARIREQVTERGLYLVEVPADGERSVERAVLALGQIKGTVQFAEPDFCVTGADATANDPLFTANAADLTKQWHLAKIMAPRAWTVLTGPPFNPTTEAAQYQARLDQTVVAIVDTGFDYTHPDLAPAMWTNPGETGGGKETNGLDDDANGKVDDWQGWDFINNDNDPMDDVGHGTHVAGIVGAVGNNATGGSGVCWNVRLLNLRIIKKQGTGTIGYYSGAVAAMDYIRTLNQLGRRVAVANHSWGGTGYSLAMLNAVNNPLSTSDPLPSGITGTFVKDVNQFTVNGSATERAKIKVGMKISATGIPAATTSRGDTVVTIVEGTTTTTITLSNYTTAARTAQALTFTNPIRPKPYGVVHVAAAGNSRYNSDRIPTYPATLPSGFMVSVGGSDASDNVAIWAGAAGSNYGRLNVDLFAPGSGIWSTYWKPSAATAPAGFIPVAGSSTQGYIALNGTSMAAPQVAATAALLRFWQPDLTDLQARQIIIENAEVIPSLDLKCISGGRLNVAKVLDRIYQPILAGSGGGTGGGGSAAIPLSGAAGLANSVAAGEFVSLAVLNGKVFVWGWNIFGLLGLPSTEPDAAVPIEMPGLSDVVAVSTGQRTCLALKSDGTVWAWGNNETGLLGNGSASSTVSIATPVQIAGLSGIVWISTLFEHAVAVKEDGSVWTWGRNTYGQLGDGTTTPRYTPTQVPGVADVVSADAGSRHTLVLKADGTVLGWGARDGGGGGAGLNALGDGNLSANALSPVQPTGLPPVAQIEAGGQASLAVAADGSVWEWGRNPQTGNTLTPRMRTDLADVVMARLNGDSALAVDANGIVFSWGNNAVGQGGKGAYVTSGIATQTVLPANVAVVGLANASTVSHVLTSEGTLYSFGSNGSGRLGIGTTSTKYFPIMLHSVAQIQSVGFGSGPQGAQGAAVGAGGVGYEWGLLKTNLRVDEPRNSIDLTGANRVIVSAGLCMFSRPDGSLRAYGQSGDGQGGFGSKGVSNNPTVIALGGSVLDFALTTGMAVGYTAVRHGMAVRADGALLTWGNNTYGQLGDGTTTERLLPTVSTSLTDVTQVSAGVGHSLVLKGDGTVWAFGRNHKGQLGNGTITDSLAPIQVPGLTGVVHVSASGSSSFVVKSDGTVWAWGFDFWPRLGIPGGVESSSVLSPTQISSLPACTRVHAGDQDCIALAQDGTVWAWGQGTNSRTGRGQFSPIAPHIPAPVVGLSGITSVHGNGAYYAIKGNGSLWAWGGGSLGDGDSQSNIPVEVVGFGASSESLSSLGSSNASDSWLFQQFSVPELLDDSLVGDQADPDADGIVNLMEYALGLDPRDSASAVLPKPRLDFIGAEAQSESSGDIALFGLPTVDLSEGKRYMALTVERYGDIRQDVDYIVEVSVDLENWFSGDPHTVTVLDTAETLEVYDATAVEDAPQRFMRLKIQRR